MRIEPRILIVLLAGLMACADVFAADPPSLFAVHFSTGPNWDPARPPAEQAAFADHSANLKRLRAEGRIRFGARYGDVGLIVLEAGNLESAHEEMERDPGVVSGIFRYEIEPLSIFYPWQERTGQEGGSES